MMSTYTDLITSQHNGKPKFEALVDLDTLAFSDIAELLSTFPTKYDLDVAVGVQLDTVGEWVGLSRHINTELPNVYFTLDDASLGFDAGLWKGPFDPTTGLTRLDDESYRLVLRAKIGANHWDGSVESLQAILDQIFTGYDTSVFTGDHQDMSMSFYMVGDTPPPVIVALLTGGYLAVKPSGVSILGYFKPSVDGSPFFALDASGEYATGLDSGALAISI
jgi:hypothetical protein